MSAPEDNLIERITANRQPHYEPFGWHHWPEHPWLSYQFRRGLGETQEGGGAVSEVFQAASRMVPGDKESWHTEWLRIAERNHSRADSEEEAGHIRTAMNCWLRAADYYRQAEFFLKPDDPRRLPTFEKMEASGADLHGRPGLDQGRDVVHAGARGAQEILNDWLADRFGLNAKAK